jgi:hypothetical protein
VHWQNNRKQQYIQTKNNSIKRLIFVAMGEDRQFIRWVSRLTLCTPCAMKNWARENLTAKISNSLQQFEMDVSSGTRTHHYERGYSFKFK